MNILITAPFDKNIIEELSKDHSVIYESWEETLVFGKGQELIDKLNKDKIEILVTEVDNLSAEVFEACPQLKLICDCRGGPTNIDMPAAKEHDVVVTYTPGRNAIAVAELTLGLMISLLRFIPKGHQIVMEGAWDMSVYFKLQGQELHGKTIGFVGFGAIPRVLSKMLAGWDMKMMAYDPYVTQENADDYGVKMVELDHLMKNCDLVSNHLPVTEGTMGLISGEMLRLMKPTSFFINSARAKTVDEGVMLELLKEGKIAGGAFDVYGTEPLPEDHAYAELPNVVMTPHIAGATKEIATHQALMVLEDIGAFLKGEKPVRQVS